MRSAANNDESQIPRQRGERFIMSSRCVTAEASVLSGVVISFLSVYPRFCCFKEDRKVDVSVGRKTRVGQFLIETLLCTLTASRRL